MKPIKLDKHDIEIITILAKLRSSNNRKNNVTDRKFSSRSGFQIDFEGLAGEYAFCKRNNLFMDVTVNPRSGSPDCFSKKGTKIDVKTSTHVDYPLLITPIRDNQDIEIYVLAVFDEEKSLVSFPGWATKDELCSDKKIRDFGYGDTYALDYKELHPFD